MKIEADLVAEVQWNPLIRQMAGQKCVRNT